MLEAIPVHRLRRSLWLGLVILGVFALGDQAEASSCHALERPIFGIDDSLIGEGRIPTASFDSTAPAHYRQASCPGESPGLPSKIQLDRASVSAGFDLAPIIEAECRSIELPVRCRPFAQSNPLERPPRNLSPG